MRVRVDVTNVGTLRWGEVSWLVKGGTKTSRGELQSYSALPSFGTPGAAARAAGAQEGWRRAVNWEDSQSRVGR